jgi:trypsin
VSRLLAASALLVGLLAGAPAEAAPPGEIVGGQFADPGEYPWMAALVLDERHEPNPFAGQICGGALISPDTVLTAAHCVQFAFPRDLDVVFDTIDLVPGAGTRIQVRQIRVHPHFDFGTILSDVAVLQLAQNSTATPIDVIQPGEEALWAPGTPATFTGWGSTGTVGTSRLREATQPIVSDPDCRAVYGGLFIGRTMVCAGDGTGEVSPCFGDSGGPMTVPDGPAPVVVGIVSWGFNCGDPNYPAVFTEVAGVSPFVNRFLDPDEVPGAVRDLRATRIGGHNRAARVQWRPPFFDGGTRILRYRVTVPSQGIEQVVPAGTLRTRLTGLPARQALLIRVVAENGVGAGAPATFTLPP